ncbi:caspase-3-like [Haliotis rubra]|uniref:caspase-3-like n=1 Tax=Haliotis rubra TaxID=36100 RepID=UPI001EE6026D|nr:caspase-3-like [Haliotis rubra]
MGGKPSRAGYSKIEDGQRKGIKIVVMGASVGKSTLIRRFTADKKLKTMAMGDSSTWAKRVTAPWTTAEMNIFEVRGPKIRLLFSRLLRNADIVLKLYDATDECSREAIKNKFSRTIKFKAPRAKVFLVGNRADVDVADAERGVFDVEEVDSKHGRIKHVVVSAETGFNVERLFSIAVFDAFPEGGTGHDVSRPDVDCDSPPTKTKLCRDMSTYKMNTKIKGLCLIINNRDFDRTDLPPDQRLATRHGTDTDAKRLRDLFLEIGFHVQQKDNLTDTEMLRQSHVSAYTEDHSQYSCFVCCILSHGSENNHGSVYGVNCRDIAISSLTYPFQARNCPSLAGKPKLFFIQACQGDKFMKGLETDVPDVVPRPRRVEIIPDEADFLLMMSTCPGYVALRNIVEGSHFMQELIATIKGSSGWTMMEIAIKVCNRVSRKDFNGYKQVPCLRSTLRKAVILH